MSVVFLTVIVWTGHVIAATPNVIKSTPDNGATGVAIDVGRIIIVFDRNMKMNSWSLMISEKGPFPPMIQEDEPWIDMLTFELRVRRLKPQTTYAIQLNSKRRKGFMSAEDQIPLPVTTITFTTVSEEGKIYISTVIFKSGRTKTSSCSSAEFYGKHGNRKKAGRGRQIRECFLQLYREQYQGAFYMLIPKGWKAEGGMIPSGVQWNVVDLVENNIRFRVTSPDGKSFFGWYPRFYFQDPAVHMQSSGGVLQPPNRGSPERMLDLSLHGCGPIRAIHYLRTIGRQGISESADHRPGSRFS